MATVTINHATLTGAVADTTALVDGPKWDAAHTVTGLENVPNVDTTNASNLSSGTVPAARMPALTGDVTTTAGAVATTIAANAVTNAKMATMAARTVKANLTSGSAVPTDATSEQLQTIVGTGFVKMWPPSNFSGNWNVVDAYGNAVSTVGSTSQGLQEAINYSLANGQNLQVHGQGSLALGSQSATLNSTTTVTGLTSTATLLAGDYVVCTAGGIPLFTTIASVDSPTQIHISHAATVTGSRTLVFTRAAGANRASQLSTTATISIPAAEQWSFQAFGVNLTGATSLNGPLLQFDSAIMMGFDWVGGQLVYQPGTPTVNSVAVLFAPTNPVPEDGVIAISDSHVFISNIAVPATGVAEAVISFNLAGGSVANARFMFNELNGTGVGSTANTNYNVKVFNPVASTSFEQNIIDIGHSHLALSAGLQIGVNTTNAANLRHNVWRVGGIKPSGASSAGISSFGSYDNFTIGAITNEEGTLNQGINLQSSSVGNQIRYGQILGAGTALVDSGTGNSWSGGNGTKIWGTTTNDSASAGMVGEYISCVANPGGTPGSTTTVTITIASPGVVTWPAHGLSANSPVVFSTTGALPTGITAGTVYWAVGSSITTNTFQFATSIANAIAGTAVNTSGSQSGVQSGQSEVPLTTGNPFNVCGISLTAGDWDVSGTVYFDGNAATTIGYLFASVGTTSATLNQTQDSFTIAAYPSASFGTVNPITVHFGPTRISIASTTTHYLHAQGSFAVNTMKAFGLLRARRVR